jgi:2-keto-4-pentenoate hydratase/2-oxohepta-3-ene-1,7-dioic acid hydratase in catechol pathway
MRFGLLRLPAGPTFARLDGATAHLFDRAPWLGGGETGQSHAWKDGDLLCPVAPSKIVCIGKNYAAHAREVGGEVPTEPLIFLKPPSALAGPGDRVLLPPETTHVEHEAELTVVFGKTCKKATRETALDYVFGYTCANDVSARDLQRKDGQWARAKGFDTFCPVGPWIESSLDPTSVRLRCLVNGETRQDSTTADMVFDVRTLIAYVSRMMTLLPGDILLTGTPEGVSPIRAGDTVTVDAAGIGALTVTIATA